jgi:hypothetical protein
MKFEIVNAGFAIRIVRSRQSKTREQIAREQRV